MSSEIFPLPSERSRIHRPPIWLRDDLLRLAQKNALSQTANAGDFVFRQAVIPATGENIGTQNTFFLRMGVRCNLAKAEQADDIFIEIGRLIGKNAIDWNSRQRNVLRSLLATYFGTDSTELGWLSLLTARRPQFRRDWEDSSIQITEIPKPSGPRVNLRPYDLRAKIPFNDVPFGLDTMQLAVSNRRRRPTVQRVVFRKMVSSIDSRQIINEWWCVPLAGGNDVEILKDRRIPSLVAEGYYDRPNCDRLSTTALLNIVKLTKDRRAMCCTLEIHPETGSILSVRGADTTFSAFLVYSSAAEHEALAEAVYSLAFGALWKQESERGREADHSHDATGA